MQNAIEINRTDIEMKTFFLLMGAAVLAGAFFSSRDVSKADSASADGAITVNIRYTGKDGAARRFAEEMTRSGTVGAIRAEKGNLRYEYYQSLEDPDTILLVDTGPIRERSTRITPRK